MEIVIKVTQFILSFSLLVVIHELGHFMFARLFGVRVEKFYLFFNPWFSLFKFKYKQTEYGMGWIPFGGYVKIAGMIDESMDTEQMKQPAKPDEFRSKPAWQRLIIMVGGVFMNVVLALCIYIGMSYAWGDRYIANDDIKHGYVYNELAQEIGFINGDKIASVDGNKIDDYANIYLTIVIDRAKTVEVIRDGQPITINIPDNYTSRMLESKDFLEPRQPFIVYEAQQGGPAANAGFIKGDTLIAFNGESMQFFDQYQSALQQHKGDTVSIAVSRNANGVATTDTLSVAVSAEGKIGVILTPLLSYTPLQTRTYTFWQAIPAGISRTGTELSNYWKQIKLIFSPNTEAYKSLGGVISIGSIFPEFWSWELFWRITAFLSIILAVMNILPIPALDGGHTVFILYEVITKRKPSDKFMEHAQMAGIMILFALLIFANGNDIYRFFIK